MAKSGFSLLLFGNDRREAAPAFAASPPPLVEIAHQPPQQDRAIAEQLDLFERDVKRIVTTISSEILSAQEKSQQSSDHLASVQDAIRMLVNSSQMIDNEIGTIAAATEELGASSDEISRTVSDVQSRSSATLAFASESEKAIERLGSAVSEIGGLLNSISEVATRTNLLALNATIEAARAGEAGRGFAVVAGEVKALSVAAAQTVNAIRTRMETLQSVSDGSIANMRRIRSEIDALTPICDTIAHAVDNQRTTVSQLANRMQVAQGAVSEVAQSVRTVDSMAEEATKTLAAASKTSQVAANEAGELGRRVVTILRTMPAANRRGRGRYPIDLPMRLKTRGESIACHTFDIGEGGILIKHQDKLDLAVGASFDVDISRIGPVRITIVARSDLGFHCRFEDMAATSHDALTRVIENFHAENRPLIEKAQAFAGEVMQAIESEIAAGRLDIDTVFDTDYQPIPGTDPAQFTTRYLTRFEAVLPTIIERTLATDKSMVFCVVTDRNGYIGVHIRKVSQPQRPGERAWNHANCRNRRIFDDRAGLLSGRLTTPYLIQSYYRDLGGKRIPMKEIDAPIVIGGRHWGGIRMAYAI